MPDADITTTAERLVTRSPERIWGLSAESVYTALAAKSAKDRLAEGLSPNVRAEMLRTNDERNRDDVVTMHDWLLDELGLVNGGELTMLGTFVLTSEEPQPLVRAIAVTQLQRAETVLRSCSEIEESLPRREFDSLLGSDREETILGPLLGSLGFLTVYPDSVEPHLRRITAAIAAQGKVSTERAVTEVHMRILPHLVDIEIEQCLEDVVERLTGNIPEKGCSPEEMIAALASASPTNIDPQELADAIVEQRNEYEQKLGVLRSLLARTAAPELTLIDTDSTIDTTSVPEDGQLDDGGRELLINVVATVSAHPEFATFDAEFLTDRLCVQPYTIYQSLSAIPGVDCEVNDEDVIAFSSLPESVDGDDLSEEYTNHLINRCFTAQHRVEALSDITVSTPPEPTVVEQIITEEYESLNDGDVAPAYFTYTLIDPEGLGEKKMNAYVGDSRGLGRETARLRRWHENRPTGLRSYTAMTDRLFSLGLERELDDKVLRIMTPFDDDTFNEYVSQIRRLLERGFELHLLTRHTKESWEWRRLQRNLLSEIKANRDQVTVRTYSRFKEHQRVSPEMDFHELGEFGIHGKLQTIGHPEEGAALLGSANFMENSYGWNPECGVYTERTQFVDAAIEFFDIVWAISEVDELSIERLQEVPDSQLVPTYYT